MPWLDKHTFPRLALVNSKRITAKPSREGFVSMCACTEPVRTGIGAVCVEYGRPKWPLTMLNHTSLVQKNVLIFDFWHPIYARTTRYEAVSYTHLTLPTICSV